VQKRIKVVRAVLDTNIFLRALIREGNICHKVTELWKADHFILVISSEILNELTDVLRYPFLIKKYKYELSKVDSLIRLISQKAIFVEPVLSLKLCRDKKDDKFIDCSVLGRVKYLVTEDKDITDDKKLKKELFEYGIDTKSAMEFYHMLISI